ncbi:acetyl-CoA carboxylase biotin carboxylase subunit [Pelagibacterales bacterium]|jgi:acetyl-CoA carboxylase, biotin carboxylase subunit|nr:acetyl-CoA carboxylase biotin carboxylase subunit [Pelagibacterales bacterium]|tara:strand:- start:3411 stop:4751 length:1341 start_codon:yes stop_codon:yes gene_type:complete
MFKKVLIANRGEIAVRINRACQELGILTVAVHSEADRDSMHVRIANESVCIGPNQINKSYLNTHALISACEITNAEAIHPGYGFLSENASFAKMVSDHGLTFIGPKYEHIEKMGDKIQAKKIMQELGVPTVPGSEGKILDITDALKIGEEIGYPVLLKAAAGGGGRGMKVINNKKEMINNFSIVRQEALSFFGNDDVYIEKFIDAPRHIEVQVIGDSHGNFVHLYERDCSVQRRNQKVIEEAMAPGIDNDEKVKLFETVINAIKKMGYLGLGTLEFLYHEGKFYFMEMNTRLQVEHPITEMITRIDLVREQISVAAGEKLSFDQSKINPLGHSIECRINAEDPLTFKPSAGTIDLYHPPAGNGIRLDTFIYSGYKVPHYYDNLLAKLIVTGRDREHAIRRALRSLDEIIIEGTVTNIELHKKILSSEDFKKGSVSIRWLEDNIESL